MNRKNKSSIFLISASALCAAITIVLTAFIKFNTGINEGYIHFGDSMIYLSACILPTPYAMLCAVVSAVISDIIAGAVIWAPISAIIKTLNVLPFGLVYSLKLTKSPNKLLNKATAFMPLISGIITVSGYLAAESFLYSFPVAVSSLPFNIIQIFGSAVIYYICASALDKINFKQRIFK